MLWVTFDLSVHKVGDARSCRATMKGCTEASGLEQLVLLAKLLRQLEIRKLLLLLALFYKSGPTNSINCSFPWAALIGQYVSITSAQDGSVGAENSLKTI